jgi:hypothetical protein
MVKMMTLMMLMMLMMVAMVMATNSLLISTIAHIPLRHGAMPALAMAMPHAMPTSLLMILLPPMPPPSVPFPIIIIIIMMLDHDAIMPAAVFPPVILVA